MVISINIRISDNGGTLYNLIMEHFALLPLGSGFKPWQLISYQFMHQTFYFNMDGSYTLAFSHILFNMFMLWMFGASIEDVFGSKRFLIFYLLAGISAGLLQLFISPLLGAPLSATVGASGSIYGVMVAYAMFFPNNLIFLYFLIPVKAKYLIGFFIVFEFLMIDSASSRVAHLAHLGGALFAFLYIMFDKNSYVELKNVFKRSYFYKSTNKSKKSVFDNLAGTFRRNTNVDEANYYDINRKEEGEVTQVEIDEILDKISQSGYQNLTEREKKILFQASKKMK
jgi:membrane associated rhomboid family serine protease